MGPVFLIDNDVVFRKAQRGFMWANQYKGKESFLFFSLAIHKIWKCTGLDGRPEDSVKCVCIYMYMYMRVYVIFHSKLDHLYYCAKCSRETSQKSDDTIEP